MLCVHESSAITKCSGILYVNREEKSLGYIAMVAKFLNDNKPKIHLKSKFAQFHLICQMLAKFSGFNLKGPYLSLEKEKETFCVVFTYSIMGAREIRKFHVTVAQRRLRKVQKSVQSCCFAYLNLSGSFAFVVTVAIVVALSQPYCCHPFFLATMVTRCHTSLYLKIVKSTLFKRFLTEVSAMLPSSGYKTRVFSMI